MKITPQLHIIMILLVVFLVVIICLLGIKAKNKNKLEYASKFLGISILLFWVIYNLYYFLLPGDFNWSLSLPLHACDIIGVVAAMAMLKPNKINRSVLYFSALALATQAFITPTGNQDPTTIRFWLYWGLHAGIISCAIFDLIVCNYRPNLKDFFICVAVDLSYIIFILPLNIVFGWNYGYIGNSTPDAPTIVDFLGVWPQRVGLIILIVIAIQFVLLIPWYISLLFAKKREANN